MEKESEQSCLIQNLKDAGCDPKTIQAIVSCNDETSTKEQMKLLCKYRKRLLDKVHKEEMRIICLDYLMDKKKGNIK